MASSPRDGTASSTAGDPGTCSSEGKGVPDDSPRIPAIRVLYVDDNPHLLEIGKIFLENFGEFEVITAL
jgi:hypothetical protein